MRRFLPLLAILSVGSLVGATSSRATTRHVPSEYATINAALDASTAGDSVLVAPGTYDEYETRLLGDGLFYSSVAFLKGGVALLSEAGASATTLRMDATETYTSVVLRAFGESGTSLVSGFMVTGTVPRLFGLDYGFGDRCIVRDCIFRDIGTGDVGAALGGTRSDLEVYGCRFENINNSSGSPLNQTMGTLILEDSEFINCRRGAVTLYYDPAFPHPTGLTARRCRFVDISNSLGSSAISVGYLTVLIENCWFDGNVGGPAIVTAAGVQIIRNCTLVNGYGGTNGSAGIRVIAASMLMEGNTFWGNHVDLDSPNGGAAAVLNGASLIFRNNVIANSTGDQAVRTSSGGSLQTSCNVYWDNPLGDTSGFQPDSTDLQADPLFCDVVAKDFHVNAASPCVPGNGHPSCTELIGAWGAACGVVSVEPWTWGHIKSAYRDAGRP